MCTVLADTSQKLCDGLLCRLIDAFEVPSDSELETELFEYLTLHGARRGNGILVGTKSEIQARASCPVCRLVSKASTSDPWGPQALGDSELYLSIYSNPSWSSDLAEFQLNLRRPNEFHRFPSTSLVRKLVLVSRGEPGPATAGAIVDSSNIDCSRAKHWLELCISLHQDTCPTKSSLRAQRKLAPRHLRVVDTEEMCLVDISWHQKYAALSYVWGITSSSHPKLFLQDLGSMYMPGVLTSRLSRTPRTIMDTINFTRAIGLRYLWFDSLCLIQDSPEDLKQGIMCMDLVYEAAYVTIVAANGPNADSGLPGTSDVPRHPKQLFETLKPGLEMMMFSPLEEHLRQSKWSSRAWT